MTWNIGSSRAAPRSPRRTQANLISDLTAASVALDNLITNIGWPIAYAARKPAGLRQSAEAYRKAVDAQLASLRGEVDAALASIPALREEVERGRVALTETATAAREGVSSSVAEAEQRLTQLTSEIDAQKARLDSLTTDYNTQFLTGETERGSKVDKALAEQVAKFETAREAAEGEHAETIAALKEQASTGLAEIGGMRDQALKLVNTIGAIGYSGGYGAYADQQRWNAFWWGIAAAGSVAALAGLGAWIVIHTLGQQADASQILLRALVSLPVFVFFAFAARESGRHRENERTARRTELELAAIGPYLAGLETVKRDEIMSELAMRMFAQAQHSQSADEKVPPLIDRLLDLVKDISKR